MRRRLASGVAPVLKVLLWPMLIGGYVGGCYLIGFATDHVVRPYYPASEAIIALVPIVFAGRGMVWALRARSHSDRRQRKLLSVGTRVGLVLVGSSLLWYWGSGTYYIGARARPTQKKARCLENMVSLREALLSYVRDTGSFPVARNWCVELDRGQGMMRGVTCPSGATREWTYALNKGISGCRAGSVMTRSAVVALYESDAGWNAAGGPELLPDKPRHLGGDNYGFADGHVQWLPRKKTPDGTWAKEPDADWVVWEPVLKESEGEENR